MTFIAVYQPVHNFLMALHTSVTQYFDGMGFLMDHAIQSFAIVDFLSVDFLIV
jgi:hypothetical protein